MRPERWAWRSATRTTGRPTIGDLAFASFVVAILSGILLALPFDIRHAYESVAQLTLTDPAATYTRNLHYWSAQLFLILTAVHIWDHLRRSTERRVPAGVWARLTLSIPLALFVMVSGFMLKGDAESTQAWRIISTLTASLPLIGRALSVFVFGTGADQQVLYIHHVATASIFLWLLVAEHAHAVWPRARAMVVTFGPIALVALMLSPSLHDNLSPIMKGPWYFLGLQETLHWLSHPLWTVTVGVGLLLVVLVLRWTTPPLSRRLKITLVGALGVYLLLTSVGLFFRGADWQLVPPERSGGTGVQFARPNTLLGAPINITERRALPSVFGRPEGCLACHAAMKGFSPAHDPAAIGCVSCHAGQAFTVDKATAHRGMTLIPGNLADATRSCGTSRCHPTLIDRVNRSVMTTMSGVINVDRAVFGESANADAAAHIADLGHSSADTHLRQLCASCHLGNAKTALGPILEGSRGGGCNACHLNYSAAALQGLRAYERTTGRVNREAPVEHPRLSVSVSNDHCFGCHSRSGRISTNYEGWMELEGQTPGPPPSGRTRTLPDGRVFSQAEPDVHFTKTLACVDCHTAREVMGDGVAHARKSEQAEVACMDCHLVGAARTIAAAQLDAESLRLLSLRRQPLEGRQFLTARVTGTPLVNAFLDATGVPSMSLKLTGDVRALKRPAAACLEGGGHARLSCISCHTAWAPRCLSCHTAFDPRGTGIDQLTDRDMTGEWLETAKDFRAAPPTLGVRVVARPNGTAIGIIETFVPGMVMSLTPDQRPPVFQRLYARASSHTTTRRGRTCESCHNDPDALGYGRGALTYARSGSGGRWTFTAAMAKSAYDGLPADAWIPFLGARSGRVSTRDDVRPFNVDEQKLILAAGACLTCHTGQSRVMRDALADWAHTLARATRKCLLPTWQ